MMQGIGTSLRLNGNFANQQCNQSLMGMLRNPNTASFGAEKNIMMQKANANLFAQAGDVMEESNDKLKKDNIKRSFSTFA